MNFLVDDELLHACKHVATISRLKYHGLDHSLVPPATSKTATVTFIEINNKTYAITAHHVIETFRNEAKEEGSSYEGYYCVQSPGKWILGPFLRAPRTNFVTAAPDIAICPIDKKRPGYINKEAFQVFAENDANWPISHAVAIGFPTNEKYDLQDSHGNLNLALSCVHAVAEESDSNGLSDQVQFLSELPEMPTVGSLSGMSGGPVFWSDGARHGLVGFLKEGRDISVSKCEETPLTKPKVNFICQRVDYAIMESWTNYIDEKWQSERDKINASISRDSRNSIGSLSPYLAVQFKYRFKNTLHRNHAWVNLSILSSTRIANGKRTGRYLQRVLKG